MKKKKTVVKKVNKQKKAAVKIKKVIIKKKPVKKIAAKKKTVIKKRVVIKKKAIVKKAMPKTVKTQLILDVKLPAHVEKMAHSLSDRKGEKVKVFDVSATAGLWEYYIVCSGASTVHVSALRDNLKKDMAQINVFKAHEDRDNDNKWIIVDFGDVLVHIFEKETRDRFAIERTFGAKEIKINGIK